MQRAQMESQMLEACRRLSAKGFLTRPTDSFSMRIPATGEMILASGHLDWRCISPSDIQTVSLASNEVAKGIHAFVYRARGDAGAVAITSPMGARLLAAHGGVLPPVFDEQVRQIGSAAGPLTREQSADPYWVSKTFARGANASLLGDQLLCLGMTCERVLLNTELYEKCVRAYIVARASGSRVGRIPFWVRLIANRRLLKDERRAAASYRGGAIPEGINAY